MAHGAIDTRRIEHTWRTSGLPGALGQRFWRRQAIGALAAGLVCAGGIHDVHFWSDDQ